MEMVVTHVYFYLVRSRIGTPPTEGVLVPPVLHLRDKGLLHILKHHITHAQDLQGRHAAREGVEGAQGERHHQLSAEGQELGHSELHYTWVDGKSTHQECCAPVKIVMCDNTGTLAYSTNEAPRCLLSPSPPTIQLPQ